MEPGRAGELATVPVVTKTATRPPQAYLGRAEVVVERVAVLEERVDRARAPRAARERDRVCPLSNTSLITLRHARSRST